MYWNSLNDCLRRQYGRKVYKLSLSSGCSCPNRDGTLGNRGCIFCDGAGAFAESGDIPLQLAAARRRVAAKAGHDPRFIAYFQSFTNTYAPVERLRTLYTAAMAPEDVVVLSVAAPAGLPSAGNTGAAGGAEPAKTRLGGAGPPDHPPGKCRLYPAGL